MSSIFDEQNNKAKILDKHNFYQYLKQSLFSMGYLIDNEVSLLFSSQINNYQETTKRQEYLNYQNPILKAIDIFLKTNGYYKGEESILDITKIEKDRLTKLIEKINNEFLSGIISKFDKTEIIRYFLRINENRLSLFVEEKTGECIEFNSTSLGRRWYLTYGFVKKLLKPKDFLFIDEPGAFLHPQTQLELRQDLEDIAQKGIYVFITTHSPYMITDNWKNVCNLIMIENGTEIQSFHNSDSLCQTIK